MNVWIGIPTGQRTQKALKTVNAWQSYGVRTAISTWDSDTNKEFYGCVDWLWITQRVSFAKFQNKMAAEVPTWDVWICGADDLYPDKGTELIEQVAYEYPDKLIWVADGLYDAQPTHPIIPRAWYQKYGQIFCESYAHNFADTDLFVRMLEIGDIVKCFDIRFDHRHRFKTGEKPDEIHKIGQSSWKLDETFFRMRHSFLTRESIDLFFFKNLPKVKEVNIGQAVSTT